MATPVVAAVAAVTQVESGHHEESRVRVDVVVEAFFHCTIVRTSSLGVNAVVRAHVVQ